VIAVLLIVRVCCRSTKRKKGKKEKDYDEVASAGSAAI